MDRWEKLSTINEIIEFCKQNPEFSKFLDKKITINTTDKDDAATWNNDPEVRFSEDHDQLIIE